ncbi:MAG: aspartate aminotransferase family protein [bacterium]
MSTYPDEKSKSAHLYERACRVLPGGNSRSSIFQSPYPIYAQSGKGCRITDVDGVERIDFLNNYTTLIHGHAHPEIQAAVVKALERGASFAHPTESEIEMAELLTERVGSFERVRFTNSGTEAVMNAVKAARAYTGKTKIAKCEGCYHGVYDWTEVSLDSTPENWGEEEPAAVAYCDGTPQSVLDDVVVIPYNDIDAAERILAQHAGELAAVIVDPLPARAGLIPASDSFLTRLRSFTKGHGILLILDEVISFRVGYHGAQTALGVQPDLTTLGKIIGGGLPVGALAGKAGIMEVFDPRQARVPVPHAGTFNANPLTMAGGLAAMRLLSQEACERLNTLGERVRRELRRAFNVAGVPGMITGMGSLFMIHPHDKPIESYRAVRTARAADKAFDWIFHYLLNHGIVMSAQGLGALSTVMTESDVDRLPETLLAALREIPKELLPEG